MTHLFDKIFIRSYTIKVLASFCLFFILKTIQSCSQVVAEKLHHATLKCQSNKEKSNFYWTNKFT